MISKKYICQVILHTEICLSALTAQEIDSITFGHGDEVTKHVRGKILYINSLISVLSDYNPKPIINSGKIKLSDKGRFVVDGKSLSLNPKKYKVRPDDISCVKEDDICNIISELLLICPNC